MLLALVMALGHYMREKSTESKGDSAAESTQTAETIESGSAGTAGKTRKEGWTEAGEEAEGRKSKQIMPRSARTREALL